jgi:hypothetical protein
MSRDPYYLVKAMLECAHRFSGAESILLGPGSAPYPYFDRVSNIEDALATAGFQIWKFNEEYKRVAAEMPTPPLTFRVRRALAALCEIVEKRLKRWRWKYILVDDGLTIIRQRYEVHETKVVEALLDAARSWRQGKDAEMHAGADRLADIAVERGIVPTMSWRAGKAAYGKRHDKWWMSPALAKNIPKVTLEEHGNLGRVIDELAGSFTHVLSPEQREQYGQKAGTAPEQPLAVTEPSSANRDDDQNAPVLSHDQQLYLIAAYELSAFDSDSRRTSVLIVTTAKGVRADPSAAKRALSDLVKPKKLLQSQNGKHGGYWLTTMGKRRAKRLLDDDPSDA